MEHRAFLLFCFLSFLLAGVLSGNPKGCCSPPQWEILAEERNSLGTVFHHIYYDSVNQLVRWDRVGNLESPNVQSALYTYTDYKKGVEYYYLPLNNSCEPYGPDQFTEWCYGPISVGQNFVSNITIAGSACTVWENTQNDMKWISSDSECLPVMRQHADDTFIFYDSTIGVEPSDFVPPTICTNSQTTVLQKTPHTSLHKYFL
eukprot:Phypoly_transcript_19645.p1 GENE.Phypoly_transcript_19645~~Phypoly_transcript_19645.p1  ORF type:complete len:203 (+),score=21.84 Phypoly_transcript_19645:74-682(+)